MKLGVEDTEKSSVGYLDVILITFLIVVASLWVYDRYVAAKIAVVDVNGFAQDEKELLARGTIQMSDVVSDTHLFKLYLRNQPKNLVILNKAAVLENGAELTFKGAAAPQSAAKKESK